jgi:hypothetical protein
MFDFLTTLKNQVFRSTAQELFESLNPSSRFPKVIETEVNPKIPRHLREELTDRQERLEWWNQAKVNNSRVSLIGAGGLGGHISRTLAQVGCSVDIVDFDLVEVSNLSRQFFTFEDVGVPKAHALVTRIYPFITRPMLLRSYWMGVEEFTDYKSHLDTSIFCVGVDNDEANIDSAKLALFANKTAVFVNVSRDGDSCRIFIQRPGDACFACYKPSALHPKPRDPNAGCPRTPAIADILQVAAGFAVRAVLGEILKAPIGDYNCRDISLSGFDHSKTVQRNPDCLLCKERRVL